MASKCSASTFLRGCPPMITLLNLTPVCAGALAGAQRGICTAHSPGGTIVRAGRQAACHPTGSCLRPGGALRAQQQRLQRRKARCAGRHQHRRGRARGDQHALRGAQGELENTLSRG